mmetsp:Transcript_12561/g.20481  ORF Transcript_12561/g.20481 Transcript_12561/m.20481 type:complete len:509 (+) Transcript_12561:50-1576(+)|eukprot:CAMPEP_0184336100 /NCGR_PEP_ID=MMETSP1089-20130417/4520_1 /TAXON_ID=38269 ORGANISM="Gloeochaete wittrockiana, Strain SAG46.84" /NCGR_SAMPLE_ID=MMETSP1089 /ASSEMBLY_ACC=CAM_ASM_000445 /LENGTH=508 /DNA_ID=CAMNT_0026661039 /DNA_START=49 /DNA_END=1575 /DNA_ORIENTATION=+
MTTSNCKDVENVENDINHLHHHGEARLAYWIILLLAIGGLLPWNCLISAYDYFLLLFPKLNVEMYFSGFFTACNVPFLLLLIKFGHFIPLRIKIFSSLAIFFAIFCVVPFLPRANTAAFWLMMGLVCLLGAATAILQGSLYAFAAQLSPTFTQAVMTGNGLAGVIVGFARLLTKAIVTPTYKGIRRSAIVYFAGANLTLVCCALAFLRLLRSPLIEYAHTGPHTGQVAHHPVVAHPHRPPRPHSPSERTPLLGPPVSKQTSSAFGTSVSPPRIILIGDGLSDDTDDDISKAHKTRFDSIGGSSCDSADGLSPPEPIEAVLADIEEEDLSDLYGLSAVRRVLWETRGPAILVCIVFLQSMSVFPGIMCSITSKNGLKDWLPLILIAEFNFFDFIGRMLPRWQWWNPTPRSICVPILLRTLLIPLFLACATPGPSTQFLTVNSDWYPAALVLLLGLTNGYYSTVCMSLGPEVVPVEDKELAGSIMAVFLNFGITCGAGTAFLLRLLPMGA